MRAKAAVDRVAHWGPMPGTNGDCVLTCRLDPSPDGATEAVWARRLPRARFELCNIPFVAYDLHLGDVVNVRAHRGQPVIDEVLRPSGKLAIRILFDDDSALVRVLRLLRRRGLLHEALERGERRSLVAVSLDDRDRARALTRYLDGVPGVCWENGETDQGTFESNLPRRTGSAKATKLPWSLPDDPSVLVGGPPMPPRTKGATLFSVQVHLDRLVRRPGARLMRGLMTSVARDVAELGNYEARDGCVTAVFRTVRSRTFWRRVRTRLEEAGLTAGAIVVCEGPHGWHDYLLLHHFDPAQTLDTLRSEELGR